MFNEAKFNQAQIAIKNADLNTLCQKINDPQDLISVIDNGSNRNILEIFRWSYDAFPSLLTFLDYCFEKKFHLDKQIISIQILFPESIYRYYFQFHYNPNGDHFYDDDFIALFSIFQKHNISLESENARWSSLLEQVTYSWSLTIKSINWLIEQGFNPKNPKHKGILENPHRGSAQHSFYEKTRLLIEKGAAEHINHFEYSHPLSVLLHNVDLPFLLLYIQNGAEWDEFIFQLIKGNTKKLTIVKHFLLQFYLEHDANSVNTFYEDISPLLLAVAQEDFRAVQLLLYFGADPSLELKKERTLNKRNLKVGQKALDIAITTNNEPIQNLLKGKEPTIGINKDFHVPKLDPTFQEYLLNYIEKLKNIKRNPGVLVKNETLFDIQKDIPLIPPHVLNLATAKWGELQSHHLQLLHVALLLGGKKLIWSGKTEGFGFIHFASWTELLGQNILFRNSDIGITFVSPNKNDIKINFSATYESYKVYKLNLSLESYLEKQLACFGLHYWQYLFVSLKYNLSSKIGFFEGELISLFKLDLEEFTKP